jgi:hypothetical protein
LGRTTIITGNRTTTEVDRFAAFKFQANGERARLHVMDSQWLPDGSRQVLAPWFEWVHRIERPNEVDGQPVQKRITIKAKKAGEEDTTRLVWDTKWVGSPICMGNKEFLRENKGLDPANCPVCARAREHPELVSQRAIEPARVRYAMNVIRYATRTGGFLLAEPLNMTVMTWSFPETRFARLDSLDMKVGERFGGAIQVPMPDGSQRQRPFGLCDTDLLLGPCSDHGMQKYDIDVAEDWAAFLTVQGGREYYAQLCVPDQMASDDQLQLACGKPVENLGWLERDLQDTVAGWGRALGWGQAGGPVPQPNVGQIPAQPDMTTGMTAMANEAAQSAQFGGTAPGMPPAPQLPGPPAAGVPTVTQPSVQPMPPGPQAPTPAQPGLPGVPTVPQPTVAPSPPGPPAPQVAVPSLPPPTGLGGVPIGGPGLEQFAPPGPSGLGNLPPGQALQAAAAPELAQMQQAQMAALAAGGVPGTMLPPSGPALPVPLPSPGAVQAAVPATPSLPIPGPSAAPAAVPGPPASSAPPTGIPTSPLPMPQPSPVPGPAGAAPEALFTAPAPPAPAQDAAEFSALANFGQPQNAQSPAQ